ncbi:MAG TPA: LPS export ABC transporter periplasmic protein LptC, partial [Candidatus Binatia bacterium]|nr:LPS export ABC transporter periplasmic protein LptC [Candidatus Binatia bacterium]
SMVPLNFTEGFMRKARRFILLLAILISLGGIGYKVAEMVRRVQKEVKANPVQALDYLPESVLQIRDFHRAKIESGRKVWELFGEEANYYKEQKEAVIKKPRFYYYDKKGQVAEAKGDEALLYLNDKELDKMELRGGIQVSFQGYVLTSEEADYVPAKDQIILPSRTLVVGEGLTLEGARMEVELEEKKIRLIQAVKTKIEPDKLAKKKSLAASDQRIEG